MVVVPLTRSAKSTDAGLSACESCSISWVTIAAAATLATGGALLVCGKPRAGLVATVTGTALAMLDQQETVSVWWNALPHYLAEIQGLLARVQETIDDVSTQRERLHQALAK
jgi:hypothetical protein